MMTAYTATVTREDDLWVVVIDGLPPHVSSAADYESLPELFEDTPELIADLTDTDPEEVTVKWRFMAGENNVTDHVVLVQALAVLVSELPHLLDRARRSLLTMLSRAGWSQREMGEVVDLSHQRVQQILTETKNQPARSRQIPARTPITGRYITSTVIRTPEGAWVSLLPSPTTRDSERSEHDAGPVPLGHNVDLLELLEESIRHIEDDTTNNESTQYQAT